MEIGSKIKLLRLKCNLTQEELADRCELSKSFISQLENDYTSPSIETLNDIVTALGTNLKHFFDDKQEKIVFAKEDHFQREDEDSVVTWLVTNSQKNEMEPILVELKPNGISESDMPHEGEEFGYVLEGKIALLLGKKQFTCKKGEAFYYSAGIPHSIQNKGKNKAKFIWVSTPPNF